MLRLLLLAPLALFAPASACKPAKRYAQSATQAEARSKCCKTVTALDVAARMATLWEINSWVTSQDWYKEAVTSVIRDFPEMTLNHVAPQGFYDGNEKAGLLPSTAQVCLRHGQVGGAGKDDITKGIGYYHFNRISVGTMTSAPNFPLATGKVEYFISPLILFDRHFIACDGNIAKNDDRSCPGKMEAMNLKNENKMKEKALSAIEKLREMLESGPKISNEIAIFGGVSWDHICETVSLEGDDPRFTQVGSDDPRANIKCPAAPIRRVIGAEEAEAMGNTYRFRRVGK